MSDREAFKAEIKRLALNAGFSLKQQPDGTMDLNPYVYAFADSVVRHTQAQAGERKCSECGNGEPDLSLYCVRCLNNDHWHLIDPDQAGDGEAVGVINYANHQAMDGTPMRMAVEETSPRSIQGLERGTKLYTAPQPVVPEGCVMVPKSALDGALYLAGLAVAHTNFDSQHRADFKVCCEALLSAGKGE